MEVRSHRCIPSSLYLRSLPLVSFLSFPDAIDQHEDPRPAEFLFEGGPRLEHLQRSAIIAELILWGFREFAVPIAYRHSFSLSFFCNLGIGSYQLPIPVSHITYLM